MDIVGKIGYIRKSCKIYFIKVIILVGNKCDLKEQ